MVEMQNTGTHSVKNDKHDVFVGRTEQFTAHSAKSFSDSEQRDVAQCRTAYAGVLAVKHWERIMLQHT